MLKSIAECSVIVTGASRGIDKGIAQVFAKQGARVLLAARDTAQTEAVAQEIRSGGGSASAVAADVSRAQDHARIAHAAIEPHGGIDMLCANAGIFPSAKLGAITLADWKHTHVCLRSRSVAAAASW